MLLPAEGGGHIRFMSRRPIRRFSLVQTAFFWLNRPSKWMVARRVSEEE